MVSLRKQIENLQKDQTIVTDQNRTGVYVAAQRAGRKISTEELNGKVVIKLAEESLSQLESIVLTLKNLPTADRLKVFEEFELCCGMNRGECVCPEEEIVVAAPAVSDKQAKIASLRALIEPKLTEKGFESRIPKGFFDPEPKIAENWVFSKDKPWYADDGNVYRKQLLAPDFKTNRTVQVDAEDQDKIVNIKGF